MTGGSSEAATLTVAEGETREVVLQLTEFPPAYLVGVGAKGPFGTRPPVGSLTLRTQAGVLLAPRPRTTLGTSELFEAPDNGPFILNFEAPGWSSVQVDDVTPGAWRTLDVAPTSAVRLFVVDSSGEPIEDRVRIGRKRTVGEGKPGGPRTIVEPMHLHRSPLAAGQRFALPAGDEHIVLDGPGWRAIDVHVEGLAAGEVRDVHVTMTPGRLIVGEVVDEVGAPVPFARVQLLELAQVDDGPASPISTPRSSNFRSPNVRRVRDRCIVDASGSFTLGADVDGPLLLRAWYADALGVAESPEHHVWNADMRTSQQLHASERMVRSDEGAAGQALVTQLVLEAFVDVAGRIEVPSSSSLPPGATGTPQATGGFDLALVPWSVASTPLSLAAEIARSSVVDALGQFSFTSVAPGTYLLVARMGIQPWPNMTIQRAMLDLGEVVVPRGGLQGLVVTPPTALPERVPIQIESTGEPHGPLLLIAVQLDELAAPMMSTVRRVWVDSNDVALLPLEPGRRWRLCVFDRLHLWMQDHLIEDTSPSSTITLPVELARGTVRVVNSAGEPLEGEVAYPLPLDDGRREGRFVHDRRTDVHGEIELVLPRGPVTLAAPSNSIGAGLLSVRYEPSGLNWPPPPGTTIVPVGR